MPIYTYRCENCGVQFERRQSFSDVPLKQCPECSKDALRKVYLPVGIVFKGSGFYATDHRSPSGVSSAKSKEQSSDPDTSSEKKSTDKQEPKETKETKET